MTAPRKRLYRKKRLKRADGDFYIDPPWATELLLGAERFTGSIWDPACGSGQIAMALRAAGRDVIATDLHDRGFGDDLGIDFLQPSIFGAVGVDNIVCNPPYGRAYEFIHRALAVTTRKVAMLLQEKFLYSEARYPLFIATPISRLLFFSSRPSMPPGDLYLAGKVKAGGGTANYVWIVWDHAQPRDGDGYAPPTAGWLIKPEALKREARRRERRRAIEEAPHGN